MQVEKAKYLLGLQKYFNFENLFYKKSRNYKNLVELIVI